jgi:hypothetical protein
MKCLAKLKEPVGFMDLSAGSQTCHPIRPSVLYKTNFVQSKISDGTLIFIGDLNDKAEDSEFEKLYAQEKDEDKAVKQFLSQYTVSDKKLEGSDQKGKNNKLAGDPAE